MSRPNNENKSEMLREMLNSYDAMCSAAMNDFADDYDLRLDGIDVAPPADLSEYVDQLLDFRTEAMNGSLNGEEKGLYDELINKLQKEPEMTSIHKMLQYSMMSALLDCGAALEGDSFQKAVDCQNLYRLISSEDLHKSVQEQLVYNLDDGGLRKTAQRTVDNLLEKEQQLEAHPLTDLCQSVIRNQKDPDVHLLFTSDFLSPYMNSLQRDLKLENQGSAMREEVGLDNSMDKDALAQAAAEQQRLEKSIADLDQQTQDLKRQLDGVQKKYDAFCLREKIPQERNAQNAHIAKTEKNLKGAKAACADYINEQTYYIDRSVRGMENHMGVEAERSAEFRRMKEALAPMRNSSKMSLEERYQDVQNALTETSNYIRRREAGSFWSRHFGESGKRYKEAVETKRRLEECCSYCQTNYFEPRAKMDEFYAARDEVKPVAQQFWKTESRLQELRGNISNMEKAGKKNLNYRKLEEKLNAVKIPEKYREAVKARGDVKKPSNGKSI